MWSRVTALLSPPLRLAARRRGLHTSPFPDVAIPTGQYVDFGLEHVDAYADRPALVDGLTGHTVRYSELRPLTAAVASGLTRRRFQRGDVLTVFASNCWEAVLVYHGVLAAGGAVNLINCHSTPYELAMHLRKVRPRLLVVTADRLAVAAAAAREAGGVEDIYVVGAAPDGCRDLAELLGDDGGASPWGALDIEGPETAVLPHSSGTSGFPKTVMLSHDNLCANVAQGEVVIDHERGAETLLAVLPFYHIYSPVLLYGFGLRRGATHVVLPRFEPEPMLRCIEEHAVTYLHLVPPLALFLMQSELVDRHDLKSVHRAFTAAAPFHAETHNSFEARMRAFNPQFELIHGYGMTELSPLSHALPRREARRGDKPGSIGVVLPNTECRVVAVGTDEDVGPGEEGEILVRGPQVMKGYKDDPEANAELIRDGWVHTHDIGHFDEDEYFYVSDRVKELIKYKGIQVAPAELEAFLLTHPAVADCGVVGKEDERAGELPAAFVVRGGEVSEKEIFDFVAERLSNSNWLRGGVLFVDEIPKTPSGKILRRILRKKLNG